jgi:hypothetical protein
MGVTVARTDAMIAATEEMTGATEDRDCSDKTMLCR